MRTLGAKPPPLTAFCGFGGGTTLCPGRHLVTTEILAFVALIIVRFDIEPVDDKWVAPTTNNVSAHATVPPYDHDIRVRVCPAAGTSAGKRWTAMVSELGGEAKLSVED